MAPPVTCEKSMLPTTEMSVPKASSSPTSVTRMVASTRTCCGCTSASFSTRSARSSTSGKSFTSTRVA